MLVPVDGGDAREMWLRVSPEQAQQIRPGARVRALVESEAIDDDDLDDDGPNDGALLLSAYARAPSRAERARDAAARRAAQARSAREGETASGRARTALDSLRTGDQLEGRVVSTDGATALIDVGVSRRAAGGVSRPVLAELSMSGDDEALEEAMGLSWAALAPVR